MPAVALLAVLAASALLPPGRWPDWVTPWPSAVAFAAQLLLLQDVLGIDSLSAGAWYVSIDLQSYALLAIGATLAHRRPDLPLWRSALPWAVAALTLASLWVFNRNAALDAWALYFFGAYGLGALAAWAPRSRALAVLFAGVCIAQLAAAALEPRPRVVLACLTAIVLATLASRQHAQRGWARVPASPHHRPTRWPTAPTPRTAFSSSTTRSSSRPARCGCAGSRTRQAPRTACCC